MKRSIALLLIICILLMFIGNYTVFANSAYLKVPDILYRSSDYTTTTQITAIGIDDPVYSVVGSSGVSINSETGILTMQPDSPAGVYVIKARSVSAPDFQIQKSITLTDSEAYPNTVETWTANGHTSTLATDDIIGDYMAAGPTNRIATSKHLDISSENGGSITLEYDLGPGATKLMQIVGLQDKAGGNTYTAWYPSTFVAIESMDVWSHIVMVMNFDTQKYKIYRDGRQILNNNITSAAAASRICKIYGLIISGDANAKLANVAVFSGEPEGVGIYAENPVMFVPAKGCKTTNQLCVYNPGGLDLTWECPEGATVDQSNVLIMNSKIIPGTHTITAFCGDNEFGSVEITVKELGSNDTANWNNQSTVQTDDTGEYHTLKPGSTARMQYNIANASGTGALHGRIVIDGYVRVRPSKVQLGDSEGYSASFSALNTSGNWMTGFYADKVSDGFGIENETEWSHIRTVVDTENKKLTTLLNGRIYSGPEAPVRELSAGADAGISAIASYCDVKDLCIYYADEYSLPLAYDAKVTLAEAYAFPKGTFQFFSENGHGESCSEIEFLISDCPDGLYESVGERKLNYSDCGKYLKMKVTPAIDTNVGKTVISEPVQITYTGAYDIVSLEKTDSGKAITGVVVNKKYDCVSSTVYIALYQNNILKNIAVIPLDESFINDGETKSLRLSEGMNLPDDMTGYTIKTMIIDTNLTPVALASEE